MNVPTITCLDRERLSLTRVIRHGASQPDSHRTRVSRVNRNAAGRVGSGQEVLESHGSARLGSTSFQISRFGSGRVKSYLKLADRLMSGQEVLKNLAGQVGSGRDTSNFRRSGRVS